MRGHTPIDLEADGGAEASAPQLGLEGAKQVIGRVVVELEIGGSGDPEWVPGEDLHAREEQVEVGGDDLPRATNVDASSAGRNRWRRGGT